MRKLRLIKPWRLQAVRQKAACDRYYITGATAETIACRGPQANIIQDALRGCAVPEERARMQAPVSDVIFAAGNNPRW